MSETKSHGPNVPSVPALGGISFSFAFRMPVMAKAKNGKAGQFTFSMNSICLSGSLSSYLSSVARDED